jgi:hypothetical protein
MKGLELIRNAMDMGDRMYRSFGDYSVTTLIQPVRIAILQKRYKIDYELPFSSRIAAFMGSGVHNHVEKCLQLYSVKDPKIELERSVFDRIRDRLITGRFDILYDREDIHDFKTAKAWKLIFDPDLTEWTEQQNIYAYLLHLRGIDVKSINVIVWYKDWSKANALRDKNYPQNEMCEYKLNLWDFDMTEEYLVDRIESMKMNEDTPDDDLPDCTPEERWERHAGGVIVKFAVLKNKHAKRAGRVLDTMEEAVEWGKGKKGYGDGLIEIRYAEPIRCLNW